MRRTALAAAALVAVLTAPRAAHAFCGFYINGAGSEMFNDATQVVLMRKGTRTVLSMQNNYKGPPEAFAMVIPVPTVLQEADVKTLPKEVFQRVDTMGAPRLVEYWEQDPCGRDWEEFDRPRRKMAPRVAAGAMRDESTADLGVTIEAKFEVGEYQIVILSARDSTGLDTWLRQENYQIPKGAEPFLRPYVESGLKFFVAKVDPKKVRFTDGRADLSPLRFHYDSDEFNLPIRLGLANSSGTQDLIVSILAPNQRYEVANYKNVTIPTNLDVRDSVRTSFGTFYAALFDRTIAKNPGAVVTEYAWAASTCDPCPGPNLGGNDFQLLGADVLEGSVASPSRYNGWDFVLTRLHARYGKDLTEDLVFKQAAPIVGGREFRSGGKLEERASPSSVNNFQARYAIRHWWTGPMQCANPIRGRWGGPPNGRQQLAMAGTGTAFAPRKANLPRMLITSAPEIGVRAYKRRKPKPKLAPAPAPGSATTPGKAPAAATSLYHAAGCSTGGAGELGALAAVGLAAIGLRRRRRS
jgi:MYXO-CTERM domain-containing protein